ncbi:Protein of unknown function [Cotesia congregata]|uniref:Uncharacterized protein n=1 Tax=Cotesia congregata TaxID=51543 RepID=A0A8J2EN68_COTCN|nr:Protein of unknown function [Cotesia congregata]
MENLKITEEYKLFKESKSIHKLKIEKFISLSERSESNIECSIYILDNGNEKRFIHKFNKVLKKSEEYCIPKFLEIIELLENKDNFLPNNDLTVVIELTEFFETEQKMIVPIKTPTHQLIIDMKGIFESKAGSDVVLLVGGKKIPEIQCLQPCSQIS